LNFGAEIRLLNTRKLLIRIRTISDVAAVGWVEGAFKFPTLYMARGEYLKGGVQGVVTSNMISAPSSAILILLSCPQLHATAPALALHAANDPGSATLEVCPTKGPSMLEACPTKGSSYIASLSAAGLSGNTPAGGARERRRDREIGR